VESDGSNPHDVCFSIKLDSQNCFIMLRLLNTGFILVIVSQEVKQ
jgi:hypothetical protein